MDKDKRKKSGRPTKAEEFRTFELGKSAIVKQWNSEAAFWEFIALQSLQSKEHLKLLIEYTYGKAPSDINISGNLDNFTVPEWFKELDDDDEK
jgi:hypothetical protein